MSLKTFFATALLALFVVAGSAIAAEPAAEPIKIGVYLPLTGQNAFGGQLELDGIRLANQEMPTVLGRPVQLVIVDNKSDKVEAANAVTRLTARDNVLGIIGSYGSSLAMAGGEVAEKAMTPVIGTSCTNPLVTVGKKYYFRACYIDPYQGAGGATYAIKNLGFKRAAILKDVSNDYAVGLAKFFSDSFVKQGGEIVDNINYNSGDQDFTPQLTQIISNKPDVLFIPAYFAEGAIIIKQARELGATFRIMGGDAMDNPDVVNIGGEAVEGFIITAFPYAATMPNMNPEAKKFTDAYGALFPGKEPNMNSALGYTCYMMFMDAITRAGAADSEAVTTALNDVKALPTVFGPLTLNASHDAEMAIGIIEIRNGQRQYIGEVTPEM